MKRAVLAVAVVRLMWPAGAVAQVDTVCSKGPAKLLADVQAYYSCVQQAAIEMEPSRETADLVAEGAVAACSILSIDVKMEASSCDANIAAQSGMGSVPTFQENAVAKLEANGHGHALVTVLRIRAARNTATAPAH